MTRALSRRSYAKHRGTSVESVRRAISSGRLKAALVMDAAGRTLIDPAIADQEWQRNETTAQIQGRLNNYARGESSFVEGPHDSATVEAVPVERLAVVKHRPLIIIGVQDTPGDDFDLDKSWVIPMTRQTAHGLMTALVAVLEETRHWSE